MTEDELEEIESAKGSIEAVANVEMADLPFDLLERASNKTTKLVANSGEVSSILGRHRWHGYKFREPVFLTTLQIETSNYSGLSDFEVWWKTAEGKEQARKYELNSDLVSADINDLCIEVGFRPPQTFFTSPKLNRVRLIGLRKIDLQDLLAKAGGISDLKDAAIEVIDRAVADAERKMQLAQNAVSERAAVQREVTQAKASLGRLKKNIDDLSLKRTEIVTERGVAQAALEEAEKRLEASKSAEKSLSQQREALQQEILSAQATLKDLKGNINLFPSEIVAFVDQGSKNIKEYTLFAALPVAILAMMFVMLINGAADLTTIVTSKPKTDITALMISRIPYVAIATALIAACYQISKVFISEMININRQRLSLTKISIIAKDVSTAAEQGLNNLSDEQVYRLRIEHKMLMLRAYLAEYVGNDAVEPLPESLAPTPLALVSSGSNAA